MATRSTLSTLVAPDGTPLRAANPSGMRFNTPVPPIPPLIPTPGQLQAESVSADGMNVLMHYARTLPAFIDSIGLQFGRDIYDRMLIDPVVEAGIATLKAGILEDGVHLTSAVPEKEDDGYALAAQITDFCATVLDDLDPSFDAVLWDMCDALAVGHQVAELVYEHRDINGKKALALAKVKVKPHDCFAFVVDAYNNLIGIMALIPGMAFGVLPGLMVGDPKQIPNLLPKEKFATLAIRPRNADPRGSSLLRAAYKAWWQKQQTWLEYLKYLTQFASPIVVGTVGPNSMQAPVAPGVAAAASPIATLLTSLQGIRNGGVVSLPNGTTVTIDRAGGNGEAFLSAIDLFDRQITTAILNQTLATMEGQHNARAASDNHVDVMQTLITQLKSFVLRMITRDLLKPLITLNFGEDAAKRFCPHVSLGQAETVDKPTMLASYVQAGYQLDSSQFIGIDEELSVPERDPASIKLLQQAAELGVQGQQAGVQQAQAQAKAPVGAPQAPGGPKGAQQGNGQAGAVKAAPGAAKPDAKKDAA